MTGRGGYRGRIVDGGGASVGGAGAAGSALGGPGFWDAETFETLARLAGEYSEKEGAEACGIVLRSGGGDVSVVMLENTLAGVFGEGLGSGGGDDNRGRHAFMMNMDTVEALLGGAGGRGIVLGVWHSHPFAEEPRGRYGPSEEDLNVYLEGVRLNGGDAGGVVMLVLLPVLRGIRDAAEWVAYDGDGVYWRSTMHVVDMAPEGNGE